MNTGQCEIQYLDKIVEPITKEERDGDEDLYGKKHIVLENEKICSTFRLKFGERELIIN